MDSALLREIITYILTGASTAVAGGTFMHLRTKKHIEKQKGRQEENTADAGKFENLEKEISFLDKRLETYRYTQEKMEKKLAGMQKILTISIGQKKYAEYRICQDLSCADRKPVLGEFHTEDLELAKNIEQ